jgi:hypothetical protein
MVSSAATAFGTANSGAVDFVVALIFYAEKFAEKRVTPDCSGK